jgi:hypothetical protein
VRPGSVCAVDHVARAKPSQSACEPYQVRLGAERAVGPDGHVGIGPCPKRAQTKWPRSTSQWRRRTWARRPSPPHGRTAKSCPPTMLSSSLLGLWPGRPRVNRPERGPGAGEAGAPHGPQRPCSARLTSKLCASKLDDCRWLHARLAHWPLAEPLTVFGDPASMGAGLFDLHDSEPPTVLAETVGGDAAVLSLRVTGPEMVFELITTAPLTEAIVTGPVTLLP